MFRVLFLISMLAIFISSDISAEEKDFTKLFESISQIPQADIAGYSRTISGKDITYNNFRDKTTSAIIARNLEAIEWETDLTPSDCNKNYLTIIWECGIGCNLGNSPFTLDIDKKSSIDFSTRNEEGWTAENNDGCKLSFKSLKKDRHGDLFGYMILQVPLKFITPGKPLNLKISGKKDVPDAWVITFNSNELITKFHWEYSVNWADGLIINVAAPEDWSGRKLDVMLNNKKVAELSMEAKKNCAYAELSIPEVPAEKENTISLAYQDKTLVSKELKDPQAELLKEFLQQDLEADNFIFPKGEFPEISWKRPGIVKNLIGTRKLKTVFYDSNWQETAKPDKPGRYGAVLTAQTKDGYTVRRFATLYAVPEKWKFWQQGVDLTVGANTKLTGIPESVWENNKKSFDKAYGTYLFWNMRHNQGAAILFAGLSEISSDMPEYRKQDPFSQDRQWWLTWKRKFFKIEDKYPAFARPEKLDSPTDTTMLHPAKSGEQPYTNEDIEQIRKVCREWVEKSGEPCSALVAKNGAILFHEAFGKFDGSELETNTSLWMASITKFMTGTLMMEFVDQGLVDLDDPVEKYLPEMKSDATPKLTVRDLFVHTNGLWGHDTWDADWNSNLENFAAHYLPHLEIHKRQLYNGIGYAIAGKIMEMISGKAIPYLFQENLFLPLGADSTHVEGTSGDAVSTCLDMAKLGQMVINKGTYGNYKFFSEKTFEKMLPQTIALPDGKDFEWGIGAVWYDFKGSKYLGHGAASGAVLRLDLANNIVIVMCRPAPGKAYKENLDKFLAACLDPLKKKL